ncbi:hypothetical protein J4H86_06760 [Spiractinospora alimapuensis]|uniref:hypothetical protein n=1 Tax=Spiractinospora alimapuensis TaxID=2820884 RepID=UPI001F3AAB77|nr:hypothetical protein [Spiractinospora alimapuensis]QVQ53452.1 hypothetical protein J4H86_06760 [Spiractinospora alimapuensis]
MAAPLIPIGIAVARVAGPKIAKVGVQKAAQRGATQVATRGATNAATQGARTTTQQGVTNTASRGIGSRIKSELTDEAIYRGTEWGIDRLQRRGGGAPTQHEAEQTQSVENTLSGQDERFTIQGEPMARDTPIQSSSAFSVFDAFNAVQGNDIARSADAIFSPIKAVHHGLVA